LIVVSGLRLFSIAQSIGARRRRRSDPNEAEFIFLNSILVVRLSLITILPSGSGVRRLQPVVRRCL
jgi:hypothetical protein